MKQRIAVYKGLGGYGTLGLEIVLSILLGLFGGKWLDGRFGTEPWLMWVGFGFGVAAAVRSIGRALRLMRADAAREEREQGNPKPAFESERDRVARRREAAKQAEVQVDGDAGAPGGPSAPITRSRGDGP